MTALPSTIPLLTSSFAWDDSTLLLELHELTTETAIAGDEGGDTADLLCGEALLLDMLSDIGGGGVEATVALSDDGDTGTGLDLLLLAGLSGYDLIGLEGTIAVLAHREVVELDLLLAYAEGEHHLGGLRGMATLARDRDGRVDIVGLA